MTETRLYEKLLGIERPWRVHAVRLSLDAGAVEVGVEFVGERLACPSCGRASPGYDRRRRTWRHLDTMQYRTLVRAAVPRVRCAEHGVQQVPVPWAEAQSRFTAWFEAMVIDWLKVASFAAVARRCRLSWSQVAGIQERAMRLWRYRSRGLVARMIKRHWDGVMTAVLTKVTNARSEATNSKIQWIKRLGCGYRNRERFRDAIYFHLGGLDLYPDAFTTHTKS